MSAAHLLFEDAGQFKAGTILQDSGPSLQVETASGKPNKEKVAKITKAQVKEIAELNMPDLNAASVEAAMSMVAGTARSMGIVVVD